MGRSDTKSISKAQRAHAELRSGKDPQCCSGSIVLFNEDTDEVKIMPSRCQKWSCPDCADYKRVMLEHRARRGHPERHIVLTLRDKENADPIRRAKWMRKQFAALVQKIRRHGWTFQYMAVLEFTDNMTPHLHILQRGRYISQRYLSEMWSDLTGSYIVYVKQINSETAAAKELTKYVTKTAGYTNEMMAGMRIYTTSADWEIDDEDTDPDYSENSWVAFHTPFKPSDLKPLLRAYGCKIEQDGGPYSPEKITGRHPPPPEWWDTIRKNAKPWELEIIRFAMAIIRGPEALKVEKRALEIERQTAA